MQQTHPTRTIVDRAPFFYGWIVWGVATIGLIITAPAQSFTMSLFIDKYIDAFALSRTTVSLLYGIGTFIGALGLTYMGRLIDRFGNRMAGVVMIGLTAIAVLGMSFVQGVFTLMLGFVFLRGFGYGGMTLVSTTAIAQWFYAKRGRMMSLTLVAFSLVQSAYITIVEGLFDIYDWREVWVLLSLAVLIIGLPVFWLLMRDRPEEFGLNPDNMTNEQTRSSLVERNWTLSNARRTLLFWVFVTGRMCAPGFGTGLIIHQISIFEHVGHSRAVAAETYALIAILSAFWALAIGYLLDHYRPGYIMSLQLAALITSMFLAMNMTSTWLTIAYAVAFGLVIGTGAVFDGSVWANLFGRLHQGTIRGFVSTALVISTSIGPVLFALSVDHFDSYDVVLWAGIGISAVPLMLASVVRLPDEIPD